jgi:WD40 repeat protein
MSGWKDWQIGEVVTEEDFQGFVQDQVVQIYADSTARTSALGTAVVEGMISYLRNTDALEYYDSSTWKTVGQDAILSQGTAGQYLKSNGGAGALWDDLKTDDIEQPTDAIASTYTIVAGDANQCLNSTSGSNGTVTINDVLQPGEYITFVQFGAGSLTFEAGVGVELDSFGDLFETAGRWAVAQVIKFNASRYVLTGRLK